MIDPPGPVEAGASTLRAEGRLEQLQRVSLEFTAAVSLEQVASAVIDLFATPVDAPTRALWLCEPGSTDLELVAERGMPAETAALFARIPFSADLPGAIAVRERRTIVSVARAEAEEEFATLRNVARSTSGFLAVPLVADTACVGVLGLGVNDELDARDLGFFEAVAAQLAQTVVRVRLTERELRRRAELEFLTNLTDTAMAATDHLDLMQRVCRAAVPTLGDWCRLYFVPETDDLPLVAFAHDDPAKATLIEELQDRYPYDPARRSGAAEVMRSGRTEYVPDLTPDVIDMAIVASGMTAEEAMPLLDALQIRSAITVPLVTKRRIVGAMQFASGFGRRYDEDAVSLAEAVGGRLAEMLESAWTADQQRSIAVTLQQALLPPVLPQVPEVDITARYWPAGATQVGGDFYDVFELPDQRWALVIGDVCGRGADAAALTSIARHTVRAAARHDASATEVMEWLNQAVLLSNRDRFCTACFATLTTVEDGVRLSSTVAGHPLPIVATADGVIELGRPGTLIGVFDEVSTTTVDIELHSGDVVVLYTDGLTDLPPPYDIASSALAELVGGLRDLPSAEAVASALHRSLLERVPDASRLDDVAVLVLRVR